MNEWDRKTFYDLSHKMSFKDLDSDEAEAFLKRFDWQRTKTKGYFGLGNVEREFETVRSFSTLGANPVLAISPRAGGGSRVPAGLSLDVCGDDAVLVMNSPFAYRMFPRDYYLDVYYAESSVDGRTIESYYQIICTIDVSRVVCDWNAYDKDAGNNLTIYGRYHLLGVGKRSAYLTDD